jgi:Zn-dependent peptidase ImmA (M78 family)
MPRLNQRIERLATEALSTTGVSKAPVPVEIVARRLGLTVKPSDFTDDISGVLVIEDGSGAIGYNKTHAKVRQRFTIAHEIGHYQLHKDKIPLFVDKGYSAVYRDSASATGEVKREREANAFAAALLMPRHLLIEAIEGHSFDLSEDKSLKELSELFGVSTQAMAFRLSNLKLIP